MAWTTPRTWSTSELVTAELMNTQVRDNLSALYASRIFKGCILPFSGTFDGHFPIDPDTETANTNWHLCNGDTQNGVTTPDLRDRFVLVAGTTYSAGATGGAATKDLSHTHGPGTLSTNNAGANHTHSVAGVGKLVNQPGGEEWGVLSSPTTSTGSADHTHAIGSGTTASGGSATQNIMPPYYALAYICYVGS